MPAVGSRRSTMLLAIDTATHLAGIALHDASGSRAATQWRTERNHTVELLPNVVALLAQAAAQASDIQAIVVTIGPGSYTGLRIGLSVAKGFCLAHGAALVAVPTLDVSAHAYESHPSTDSGLTLCAMLQAGRGRLAVAFYRVASGEWRVAGEKFFGYAADLAAVCANQSTFFVGEVDDATERTLRERLDERATFAPAAERSRDPRVLARLGWLKWQRGATENVETLAPIYQ